MVYDENNNHIANAEISVAGVNHDVTSGKKGFGSVNYHHAHIYTLNFLLSLVKEFMRLNSKHSADVISCVTGFGAR